MIITRGLTDASCSSHFMPNSSASVANDLRNALRPGSPPTCWKCTRMKNSPVWLSPNCAESRILLPRSNRNPDTAWTMPGRSGHDNFKIKLCSVDMNRYSFEMFQSTFKTPGVNKPPACPRTPLHLSICGAAGNQAWRDWHGGWARLLQSIARLHRSAQADARPLRHPDC